MATGKNARKRDARKNAGKPPELSRLRTVREKSRDPDAPVKRIRSQLAEILRANPAATVAEVVDALNAWAKLGHEHAGQTLWGGERPFGEGYVASALWRDHQSRLRPALRQEVLSLRIEHQQVRRVVVNEPGRKEPAKKPAQRKPTKAAARKAEEQRRAAENAAEREAERLEARAKTEAEIRAYFVAAGIAVEFTGVAARLDGRQFALGDKATHSVARRREWVDRVGLEAFGDVLLARVVASLGGIGPGVSARRQQGALRVVRGGAILATIRVTEATVRGRPPVQGNFFIDGPHWAALRSQIVRAIGRQIEVENEAAEALARRQAHVLHLHTAFPDAMPGEQAAIGMNASRALRRDRNLAFGHTIELHHKNETLAFSPIRLSGDHAEVPVLFTRGRETVECYLRLTSDTNPMALLVRGIPSAGLLGRIWIETLVGYTTLTCREDLTQTTVRRKTPATGSAVARGHRQAPTTNGPKGASRDFGDLLAIGETARWVASYVAGHRRRLRPTQHASDAATARARRVGITLRPNETWVSPHVRGVPEDAVLKFRWTPPRELAVSTDARPPTEELHQA